MQMDDYLIEDDDFELEGLEYGDVSCEGSLLHDDDDFLDEVMDEHHQESNTVTFHGRDTLPPNANSDGYIPNGTQELTSTISDSTKTFKLYSKDGHDYVLYNGSYYRIDGPGTVTIGGIKYDKI